MVFPKSYTAIAGTLLLAACDSTPCPTQNNVFGVPACTTATTTTQGTQVTSRGGSIATDITGVSYSDNGTPADFTDDKLTVAGADFDGAGTYSRFTALDRGGMQAFLADFTSGPYTYYAVRGATPSGDITVFQVTTPDNFAEGDHIAGFERASAGNQSPTSGNATYTGRYAGTSTNQDGAGNIFTQGDVTIFVEFGEGNKVTGSVTNRTTTVWTSNLATQAAAIQPTIILNEGTINANEIYTDGTTTIFDSTGTSIGDGTHVGAIGGPNGSEVGGYVEVTEKIGDVTLHEFGVYTAGCIPGANLTCSP